MPPQMHERYGEADLNAYIKKCFADLVSADPSIRELKPSPKVAPWEADWFMRGLRDLRLFHLEPRTGPSGFIGTWVISDINTTRDGQPLNRHFFDVSGHSGSDVRRVLHEVVTHLAAASRLVGEFGHEPATIRSNTMAMDIVVYDRPARDSVATDVIAAEVKVTGREMTELFEGMRACGGVLDLVGHTERVASMLGVAMPKSRASNHHKKCLWLRDSSACLFWAVSRDDSRVFSVVRPSSRDKFALVPEDESKLSMRRCG